MTDHPDAEVLAEWLDGRLSRPRRVRAEDHLSRCDDCYCVAREAAMTLHEIEA